MITIRIKHFKYLFTTMHTVPHYCLMTSALAGGLN
jgi:hypothetical protein